MRAGLSEVVAQLLAGSEAGGRVSIDQVAEAIGTRAIDQTDVEAIFEALEAQGREVWAPSGGSGVAQLGRVLGAARPLRASLGRAPSAAEIAASLGVPVDEVHRALLLGKVMGRLGLRLSRGRC